MSFTAMESLEFKNPVHTRGRQWTESQPPRVRFNIKAVWYCHDSDRMPTTPRLTAASEATNNFTTASTSPRTERHWPPIKTSIPHNRRNKRPLSSVAEAGQVPALTSFSSWKVDCKLRPCVTVYAYVSELLGFVVPYGL